MRVLMFLGSIVLMLAGAYSLITKGFSVGWLLGLLAGALLLVMSVASFVNSSREDSPSIVPNYEPDEDVHNS